jgi:predicted transcriptional regulator
MAAMTKFASQMDDRLLAELKAYAKASDRKLSGVIGEAVAEYLARARVRPAFREATEEVLAEHAELLQRLAR